MNDKKDWTDEPTPLTNKAAYDVGDYGRESREDGDHVESDFARDLERRLRHAWKLVNSLWIDVIHEGADISPCATEQRLADIEEVLLP